MSDSHSGDKSTESINPGDTRIPHTEDWGEEIPLPDYVLRSCKRVEPIFPSDPAAALREIICRKRGSVQLLMLAASPPDFQRWINEAWQAWREHLPAAQPPPKWPIVGSDAHQTLDALEDLMRELNRLFPPTPSAQEERSGAVSDPAKGEQVPASARKRGPKRRYDPQKDQEIAEEWQRAKGTGVTKKDFAKGKNLSFKALNRILNRHAKRHGNNNLSRG